MQDITKQKNVVEKPSAVSNDADNFAGKKSFDKSMMDLDPELDVSDELDEELYGQFADVISKVRLQLSLALYYTGNVQL